MNIREIKSILETMKIDFNILVDGTDYYTITFPKPLLVKKEPFDK